MFSGPGQAGYVHMFGLCYACGHWDNICKKCSLAIDIGDRCICGDPTRVERMVEPVDPVAELVEPELSEAALFYASFEWPLRTLDEVRRLLASPFAPTDLVGCEFSGKIRSQLEDQGRRALSVDLRECDTGGVHACID